MCKSLPPPAPSFKQNKKLLVSANFSERNLDFAMHAGLFILQEYLIYLVFILNAYKSLGME